MELIGGLFNGFYGIIVESRLLGDRLERGYYACKEYLNLAQCISEQKFGCASLLHLKCEECGAENRVKTSKAHIGKSSNRHSYDIKTKVARGKKPLSMYTSM